MASKLRNLLGAQAHAFLAVTFGSAPGLLLPFVAGITYAGEDADNLLLITSTAVLVNQVVASTLETLTVAELGRVYRNEKRPSLSSVRALQKLALSISIPGSFLLLPAVLWLYSILQQSGSVITQEWPAVVIIVLLPLLANRVSIWSGDLIARGNYIVTLYLQAIRTAPALIAVVLHFPTTWVAAFFVLGELIRWRLTYLVSIGTDTGPTNGPDGVDLHLPKIRDLYAQSLSMLTSSANPVIDKAFLVTSPAGAIVAYEVADRLFFALSHGINQGVILPVVRRWPKLLGSSALVVGTQLRRDIRKMVTLSSLLAVLALPLVGFVFFVAQRLGHHDIATGCLWSLILFVSLPFTVINTMGARAVILARISSRLLIIAALSVVLNIVGDSVLFQVFGPVGIIVATLSLRVAVGFAFWIQARGPVTRRLSEQGGR